MEATHATAAAPSRAKTPPRWTARRSRRPLGGKNIVAAGLASKCEVQLAYAIGVAQPVSISVETFGHGKVPGAKIEELIARHF